MKKTLLFFSFLVFPSFIFSQELLKSKENAHEGGVNAVCISSDASFILSCGNDMKTYVWNPKTLEKLKGAIKHNDKVAAIAVSASNKLYISGCADMKVRVVDI